MMKAKRILVVWICGLLFLQTACGNTREESEAVGNGSEQAELQNGTGDQIGTEDGLNGENQEDFSDMPLVLYSDWRIRTGEVPQTWQKDYTSAEWEDGTCLNVYINMMEGGQDDIIGEIEEELNHQLYRSGYDFYVHFIQPSSVDEFFGITVDERVAQRIESGTFIDLYVTSDYREAVENGALLDLTEYLQSVDGDEVYEWRDPLVWQQVTVGDERIYGVPLYPIAATRCVYAYNPQLVELLGLDMTQFAGDVSIFEAEFPDMTERRIAPIEVEYLEDYLFLSLFGMENYKEIFAVRHMENDWEAVDLFMEEETVSFYEQLGEWKENGYLSYSLSLLYNLGLSGSMVDTEMNSSRFDYVFLELLDADRTSWNYDVNMSADVDYMETSFYVPQTQAYVTENENTNILVINADTAYPQECKQLLKLLTTDEEIRLLLSEGIENRHYMWQDEVEIHVPQAAVMGLELYQDLRYWPAGHWGEKYATEIEELNQNVSEGISLTVDCDFAGLEEQYEACRQLFEENLLIFLGYYGAETGERLQALHEQLNEAGYQELIAAVNAMH